MPSGRTHDAITFSLAVPAFAAAYSVTQRFSAACLVAGAFIFGGLMFGPDLDTVSRQSSRWSVLRFMWVPYRSLFRHRSRFSHGLIFGSLFRVAYLYAALAVAVFSVTYVWAWYAGGHLPWVKDLWTIAQSMGNTAYAYFGQHSLVLSFAGVWLGAASHTFTDMAGSFVRTGKVIDFL